MEFIKKFVWLMGGLVLTGIFLSMLAMLIGTFILADFMESELGEATLDVNNCLQISDFKVKSQPGQANTVSETAISWKANIHKTCGEQVTAYARLEALDESDFLLHRTDYITLIVRNDTAEQYRDLAKIPTSVYPHVAGYNLRLSNERWASDGGVELNYYD